MTAILTVLDINKQATGRRIPLTLPEQTIGRGGSANIILEAEKDGFTVTIQGEDDKPKDVNSVSTLSRVHAKFTSVAGVWMLADLTSSNGTFLNSARVEGVQKPVNNGDIIYLSNVGLLFTDSNLAEEAVTVVTKEIEKPAL